MALDKRKLKTHLKERGLTQGDLAVLVGKDIRTVRRWLSPKESLGPKAIEKICEALQTNPDEFDPDWSGSKDRYGEVQIGARISPAAANGYTLLKRQYGVSKKQLIELAPIIFSVIAERALSRGERKENKQKKLDLISRALELDDRYDEGANQGYEEWLYIKECARAAQDGRVFGLEEAMSHNLFNDELMELAENAQHDWFIYGNPGSCPNSQGFLYSEPLVDEITCGDINLRNAIAEGRINLSMMDDHLWEFENRDECLRWLRHQAANSDLREKREKRKLLANLRKRDPELAKRYEEIFAKASDNVVALNQK